MSNDKKQYNVPYNKILTANNQKKKIPLQRYWTSRYVITLAIGLLTVAIISAWWIRHTTFENRISMMKFMAEETAIQVVQDNITADEDSLLKNLEVKQFLEQPGRYMQMNSDPSIYLVNVNGEVMYSNTSANKMNVQLNPEILYSETVENTFYSKENHDTLYMIKAPIKTEHQLLGWVVFFELKGNLTEVNQEYKQLFIMIGTLAVLGWLAIFFMSRKLAKPITDVAEAAERIKEGAYDLTLSDDVREKEVYDLIHSFKEMAGKLEQLENLRSELLAGVTHELKTPVTSISGLLQAVKDGVVEGEEARDFINISLKETTKMKLMVEDLLAFNSFVANAVPLNMKQYKLNEVIQRIVHEWEVTHDDAVTITVHYLKEDQWIEADEVRLQQIIVNLLNNALQAMHQQANKEIQIHLAKNDFELYIDISDKGTGISENEQPFIFERFYRGEEKKFHINGFYFWTSIQ